MSRKWRDEGRIRMAMLVEKMGLIRDRSSGLKEICYRIRGKPRSYLLACKRAHETIASMLSESQRNAMTGREMKRLVLQFVELDARGRRSLLSELLRPEGGKAAGVVGLPELLGEWRESRLAEGGDAKTASYRASAVSVFFESLNLRTTADLDPGTAHKYMAWRSRTRFGPGSGATSASTIKKEVDVLRQLARMAAARGLVRDGGMWDGARVRAVAGVNRKVVEPLGVGEQKALLLGLRARNEAVHDVALFLLLTGIRRGELAHAGPDSFGANVISLHGNAVGRVKTTGKTSSAGRVIPSCPTVRKLAERGSIFRTSSNALRLALGKWFKGVHAHRLRHSFAVNKLLAGVDLKMVSYQMGHAGTAITSDLYGRFVPEHFKAGFEEASEERKAWLDWLENRYFDEC